MWRRGTRRTVGRIWKGLLETFGRWRTLTWSVEERNRKRSMYFVCDFNGRRLKDLSLLCCIDVLLSVEGGVVLVIKCRMLPLTNISTFLLGQRLKGLIPRYSLKS
jgi:hypothetical protein